MRAVLRAYKAYLDARGPLLNHNYDVENRCARIARLSASALNQSGADETQHLSPAAFLSKQFIVVRDERNRVHLYVRVEKNHGVKKAVGVLGGGQRSFSRGPVIRPPNRPVGRPRTEPTRTYASQSEVH